MIYTEFCRCVRTFGAARLAQALADWAQVSPTISPSVGATREARFLSGGFTTASGEPGTFEGPWALSRWEATGDGLGRRDGLLAAPGYPLGRRVPAAARHLGRRVRCLALRVATRLTRRC